MKCPKCKNTLYCGCKACKDENEKLGRIVNIPVPPNADSCGHCGLTMSIDCWLDEEWKQMKGTQFRDKQYNKP